MGDWILKLEYSKSFKAADSLKINKLNNEFKHTLKKLKIENNSRFGFIK